MTLAVIASLLASKVHFVLKLLSTHTYTQVLYMHH